MVINTEKSLAVLLRDQRIKLGMNQSTVADLVGIKQATISAIENHPTKSKIGTLLKVLSALGLELQLVDKNEPNTTNQSRWSENW